MKKYLTEMMIVFMLVTATGCAQLAGFAMDAIGAGAKGGINTELVVGDKEQTIGNNLEVKADKVDKVVGSNDNSVEVTGEVDMMEVTNINYPTWLIVVLLVGNVVFLCLPTPTTMWKSWRNRK